jgi:[calcium/calmodulin-dependent protein kinase] kinase
MLQEEAAILMKLDHQNVVSTAEVIDDPEWKNLYFVMEYVEGGPLSNKISAKAELPMETIWRYFRDILMAIEYCHEVANIVHRDIKPENILVTKDDRIKLADFGLSKMIDESGEIEKTAGSNYFFSPEACRGSKYKGKPNDLWALGITLYYMIYKKLPFWAPNFPDLFGMIMFEEPEYPDREGVTPDLLQFIKGILTKDVDKRLNLV